MAQKVVFLMTGIIKFIIDSFVLSIDNIKNKNIKSKIRKIDARLLIFSRKNTKDLIVSINEKVFAFSSVLIILTVLVIEIFKISIYSNCILNIYVDILGIILFISGFLKLAYDKSSISFMSSAIVGVMFFSILVFPLIFSFVYFREQKLIMFLMISLSLTISGIIYFLYRFLPIGSFEILRFFLSSIKRLLLLIHKKFEKGVTLTLFKFSSLFLSMLK